MRPRFAAPQQEGPRSCAPPLRRAGAPHTCRPGDGGGVRGPCQPSLLQHPYSPFLEVRLRPLGDRQASQLARVPQSREPIPWTCRREERRLCRTVPRGERVSAAHVRHPLLSDRSRFRLRTDRVPPADALLALGSRPGGQSSRRRLIELGEAARLPTARQAVPWLLARGGLCRSLRSSYPARSVTHERSAAGSARGLGYSILCVREWIPGLSGRR